MALSQCLDESPLRFCSKRTGAEDQNLQEVYDERHRLGLEQLLSGGLPHFLNFLREENTPNFLSDDEIQRIRSAAVSPRCPSVHGDDPAPDRSLGGSVDCSSVTYFPEVSDVEPPLLELGWPAFTAGSYRGVTRAVAHFQPSYGDTIYSCKEAARRMIRSSREVIAIVTDSLTDLDIFKDLKEACCIRKVPVYVLLDQSCAPAFLKMCRNVGVDLDDLRQMRVRTITGTTYYMRSGARITGQVHERFMLIDGNRVATGSYRFNWTDGKLNSSNLVELSGQITEKFDEEFRILYAQSLPINARGPPSVRNSAIFDHHLSSTPYNVRHRPVEHVCVTSTPNPKLPPSVDQPDPSAEVGPKSSPASEPSTIGEEWAAQQDLQEEVLAGNTKPSEEEFVPLAVTSCHVSTQTSRSLADQDTQTHTQTHTQVTEQHQNLSASAGPTKAPPTQVLHAQDAPDLKTCFYKLTSERQHHYSAIRSKLERMVTTLSKRRELADITNMTAGRGSEEGGAGPNPRLVGEGAGLGTWPRARCLH